MLNIPNNAAPQRRQVPANKGLVVEEPLSGWVGAVMRVDKTAGMFTVTLEDRHGRHRAFPLSDEFWLDGQPIALIRPISPPAGAKPKLTASGSVAAPTQRAKTARASRLWVEGRHDAELIEHVWGDDLRDVGVVVELLDGVDNLAEYLADFGPTATKRAAVLVDHLVPGTKESRLVQAAISSYPDDAVLVRGHKFIDIWQAVKPERIGLKQWPQVSRDIEWKYGILTALGWPHVTQNDIAAGWHRILSRVRDFRDLEPSLLAPVEELIDFVTTV